MAVAGLALAVTLAPVAGTAQETLQGGTGLEPIDPSARSFRVTYVGADALYIDGGREAGLEEGMRLTVRRMPAGAALSSGQPVAEMEIFAVTGTSAAGEITELLQPVAVGDTAFLSTEDRVQQFDSRGLEIAPGYVQLVSFSGGDPILQEVREAVPRPPLPEVNRVRGQVGIDHISTHDRSGPGSVSYQESLVVRADFTRLGGTYWNLSGYWRGRLNARRRSTTTDTLTDLISRVYNIGLFYNNPQSNYTAGVGRVILPWATSLNTLDGGYLGRRFGSVTTVGGFGGTTPDPTAWNYDPDRQMFGAFVNFESGSISRTRHSGTVGVAMTRLGGLPERRFLFVENALEFGGKFSVRNTLEMDHGSQGRFDAGSTGPVLSRSATTVRVRPDARVMFDLNHNYFRVVPTFDPRLVGSGLLDDILFEGISGGVRVDVADDVALYTHLGRSERVDDPQVTLNRMFGVTWSRIPGLGIRADARYSLFDGIAGSGSYRTLSLSHAGESLRIEVQGGVQDFGGLLADNRSRFVTAEAEWFTQSNWILRFGGTVYRGNQQEYDQFTFGLSYRFSSNRPTE